MFQSEVRREWDIPTPDGAAHEGTAAEGYPGAAVAAARRLAEDKPLCAPPPGRDRCMSMCSLESRCRGPGCEGGLGLLYSHCYPRTREQQRKPQRFREHREPLSLPVPVPVPPPRSSLERAAGRSLPRSPAVPDSARTSCPDIERCWRMMPWSRACSESWCSVTPRCPVRFHSSSNDPVWRALWSPRTGLSGTTRDAGLYGLSER